MLLTQDNSTTSNFVVIYVKNSMHAKSIHIYTKEANIAPLVIAYVGHYQIGRESEQWETDLEILCATEKIPKTTFFEG